MKNAEDFAFVIAGTWGTAETWRDWFQIRSWCHGAAMMSTDANDMQDIMLLQYIASHHQYELEFAK